MSTSISPSFTYPRSRGGGLGAAGGKQVSFEVGDGTVATGEAKERVPPEQGSGAFSADTLKPRTLNPSKA